MFLIALFIAGIGIYFFGASLTGFVIKENIYSENLNLVVTSNGKYMWQPKNIGELKSLKLDGKVTNSGAARVYIESNGIMYLIFDSRKLNESTNSTASNQSSLITGFAVNLNDNKSDDEKDEQKKNHKPEWVGDNKLTLNGTTIINLSEYFKDEYNNTLVYSASSDSDKLSVSVSNGMATLTPSSDDNFNTTVNFIASDGINSASQIVGIIAVVEKAAALENSAPVWNSNIDKFIINGTTIIDLSKYFTDKDDDALTYSVSSDSDKLLV